MPVNLSTPVAAQLLPVAGVSLGTAEAGIKRTERKDLLVIKLDEGATSPVYSPPTVSVRLRL